MTIVSVLLVGCGKMGGALLSRWQDDYDCSVIEPHNPSSNKKFYSDLAALPENFIPSIIIFAVKPQQLAEILPEYHARFSENDPLYISIAAGKTLSFFATHLGSDAKVVRAMPNTPALVKKGITALCASSSLSENSPEIAMATQLMKAAGETLWVDESQMDSITAISGCGPAYVFLFVDSLVKAGIACGLTEKTARELALKTISGSCALAEGQADQTFEQLRKNVTSPGGSTEAALKILLEGAAFEKLIINAVFAAKKRSKELS